MNIHVALQIALAAEAPGALTARMGFLVGFRGHFGCLCEESYDVVRMLGSEDVMRMLGYLQGIDKRKIAVIQWL